MLWSVEGTNEFAEWFGSLSPEDQDAVDFSVGLLIELGPNLQRPHADTVHQSRFKNMRELRSQSHGNPLRTLYAFDPRRTAILLIGGDKTGDVASTNAWYRKPKRSIKNTWMNLPARA